MGGRDDCLLYEVALDLAVSQMYGQHGEGNPYPMCQACVARVALLLAEAEEVLRDMEN